MIPHLEVYIWYIFSDIQFWHSFWHLFWHFFWHSFWHLFWDFFWHLFWNSFRHLFWHFIWHSIWHSFWHMYLDVSGISSEILSGILSGISSEFLRGWSPAGNTLIRSLRWRSGAERSDPAPDEGGGRRRKKEGGLANIKFNNPHLTGGENGQNKHDTNRTRRNSSYRSCDKRISM